MKNRIVLLILAILFGLAAAYGVYQYIQQLENTYQSSQDFISVAVAKQKIPARQPITEPMIGYTQIPSNYVNSEVLGKPEEIIGQVARNDIYPGEQILKSKLINPSDTNEGLSLTVEQGRRAMTIAVDDVSGLAGMIVPGDHVDVLGTVTINNETMTSTLVQDIKVLAVNKSMSNRKLEEKQLQNSTLTFSVDPYEAQHIALAADKGSIRLLLRTPADGVRVPLPSTKASHLIR